MTDRTYPETEQVPTESERGNYEDRHPNDMVLHPLTEIREWDEALAVLGIQDSDQTPADAIRELNAEIERLRGLAPRSDLEPSDSELIAVLNAAIVALKSRDQSSFEMKVLAGLKVAMARLEDRVSISSTVLACKSQITPDLMNQTTVSCSGKEITIFCNDHDTKDALMNALTDIAYAEPSPDRTSK